MCLIQVVASGRKSNLCRDLRWVAKRTPKFPHKSQKDTFERKLFSFSLANDRLIDLTQFALTCNCNCSWPFPSGLFRTNWVRSDVIVAAAISPSYLISPTRAIHASWVGWPNGEILALTCMRIGLDQSGRKSSQVHAKPGRTESRVDPIFQLASTCNSVGPGLKELNF